MGQLALFSLSRSFYVLLSLSLFPSSHFLFPDHSVILLSSAMVVARTFASLTTAKVHSYWTSVDSLCHPDPLDPILRDILLIDDESRQQLKRTDYDTRISALENCQFLECIKFENSSIKGSIK